MILAAGASSRMGRPKAFLSWGEGNFLRHTAARLETVGLAALGVVTRADLEGRVREELPEWSVWVNEAPEEGMLSSLQVALRGLGEQVEWLLVSLVDQPRIRPETFVRVAAEARRDDWCSASYERRAGHPVAIGRDCFGALLAAPGAGSPREVLAQFPRRFIDCDDPGVVHDVDRPEDL